MSIRLPSTTGPIRVWTPTRHRWSGGSQPAGTRRQTARRYSSRLPWCGTARPGSAATCNGTATASRVGRELAGRTLLVFATGDDLVIFYTHHLVRKLTLDRSRRYQRFSEPRRRDPNRAQLLADLNAAAHHRAGPQSARSPRLPGVIEAPGQGRPKAVAKRARQQPLRRRNGPHRLGAAAPATTPEVSPMS